MVNKNCATVMVLGVVSNEGDVMPPYFFSKGLKISAEVYLTVLRNVVKPWMDKVAAGRHYVFQQDGAPAHTAKATQIWLKANVPELWEKEVWPPSSPDCNPLDYYVWSMVEKDVNQHYHTSVDSLKNKIQEVMTNLDKQVLVKACQRFRRRVEAVIDAEGSFIA